jgi:hypothetical protein
MSDAPERIWVAGNGKGGNWGFHNGLCHTFGGIEYIRVDRIEALTAERDEANKRGDAWRFRADIAEAKLAKAVEALREIADAFGCECGDAARATLAEIEGERG